MIKMLVKKYLSLFFIVSLLLPLYSHSAEKSYPWYKHGAFALATCSSAFYLGVSIARYHYYSEQINEDPAVEQRKSINPKDSVRVVVDGRVILPDSNGEVRYKDNNGNEVTVLNDGTRIARGNVSISDYNSSSSMSHGNITVSRRGSINISKSKGATVFRRCTRTVNGKPSASTAVKSTRMQELEERRDSYFYKMCGLTLLTAACSSAWYWAANKRK